MIGQKLGGDVEVAFGDAAGGDSVAGREGAHEVLVVIEEQGTRSGNRAKKRRGIILPASESMPIRRGDPQARLMAA